MNKMREAQRSLTSWLTEEPDEEAETKDVKDPECEQDTPVSVPVFKRPTKFCKIVITVAVLAVVAKLRAIQRSFVNITRATRGEEVCSIFLASLSRWRTESQKVVLVTYNLEVMEFVDDETFDQVVVRIQPIHPRAPKFGHSGWWLHNTGKKNEDGREEWIDDGRHGRSGRK